MRRMPLLVLALFLFLPFSLGALEVRFHPGEVVYPYEVDPSRGLSSVVLQHVAFVQREGGPITLDSVEIQVLSGGQAVQTQIVPAAVLDQSARQMSAMEAAGLLKLYDFHFQTSRSLGEGIKTSPSRTLDPGTGLLLSGRALLLAGPAEEIAVLAHARDAAGKPVEARGSVRVTEHKSPNEYWFPLKGTLIVVVGPDLESPHRWAVNQEFAIDVGAVGAGGNTHQGAGSRLSDYYGYGRDILAVADGTVVAAVDDCIESDGRLRQPGESGDEFQKRLVVEQNKLLAQGVTKALGCYVVIRHAGGEHSHSLHLKPGSVRIRPGDTVRRGQVIGQLGHSGNSTEPHLHFHLTDGADPMYSRGLPILFENIVVEGFEYEARPLQSGWIVTTKG